MGENRVSMIGGEGHTNQRKRKPDQTGVRERLGRGFSFRTATVSTKIIIQPHLHGLLCSEVPSEAMYTHFPSQYKIPNNQLYIFKSLF
jgi:hypothetical protein